MSGYRREGQRGRNTRNAFERPYEERSTFSALLGQLGEGIKGFVKGSLSRNLSWGFLPQTRESNKEIGSPHIRLDNAKRSHSDAQRKLFDSFYGRKLSL